MISPIKNTDRTLLITVIIRDNSVKSVLMGHALSVLPIKRDTLVVARKEVNLLDSIENDYQVLSRILIARIVLCDSCA